MGKIVKYCNSCDEGFAEKFGFCPNCGQSLQAFEMNPLAPTAPPVEETTAAPIEVETAKRIEPPAEVVAEAAAADETPAVIDEPVVEEPVVEEPVTETTVTTSTVPTFVQSRPVDVDRKPRDWAERPASLEAEHDRALSEGGFYVTVIEEKNAKQRNTLLLGTLCCMVIAMLGLTVYSLFAKELGVGAIGGDDMFLASLADTPVEVEEEMKQKKEDKGGGGGGGGNNDPNPASKGERAPMRTDPEFTPSVSMTRLTNPTIPIQMAIKGPINENKIVDDRYGVKLGGDIPSDGPGFGGGQGNGRGGGQGNGNGLGAGNGNGSGLGNGDGNGIGDGSGSGGSGAPPPSRPRVTTNLNIISKPKATYTDAARQNNVQGSVILRVTFLANGQIGSISPVKGLPYGLTEQAIAAARRITFEPKKVDGVGQSVTKQIEYGFNIY
jgi:TonB family protein